MSWRLVTAEAGPCEQRATCLLLSPAIIPSLAQRRLWKEQDWFKLPWGLRGNEPCRSLFFLSPLSSFVVVVVSLKLPLPKARIESLPGCSAGTAPDLLPASSQLPSPRSSPSPGQPQPSKTKPKASHRPKLIPKPVQIKLRLSPSPAHVPQKGHSSVWTWNPCFHAYMWLDAT